MAQLSINLAQSSATAVEAQVGNHSIFVDRPIEKGGGGLGLMGGQHMLIGIGGCFCSTLFAAAQSRGIEVEGLSVEVSATLAEEGAPRFTAVHLGVTCQKPESREEIEKLIAIAEKGCISINTVKTGLDFSAELSV
ncbi:OsmC family protein [Algoriphagus aquimarinus]|uniref:Putative redox protein n=1 Tax=Algoriphagus aquimarinus TaxID=237018 RepID=A0A1I0W155_9BACT|nr:OsmC family protein [Algoriphagus aquimarinus]SFA81656.1 putative redox protein [Algoriphagus aquimarinus]